MADRLSTATPEAELQSVMREVERLEESEFVLDFVEKSQRLKRNFEPIWDEVICNYLVSLPSERNAVPRIGSPSFATAPALIRDRSGRDIGRSELKDPETNQIVDAAASQGIALMMPNLEFIRSIGIGMDDEGKERFLSRLLQGILQSPGNYGTHFLTFKDGFLLGTAILEIGWETRSRLQMVRRPTFDEDGMMLGFDSDVAEVVYRDQPLLRTVDIFDFFPDPSGTRIQEDMLGVVKRFRISGGQALDMADAGVYNMAAVRRAIDAVSDKDRRSNTGRRRFQDTLELDTSDRYRMLTGLEFWGEYPGKRPSDGARNRVITLLEGEHVRSHINPYLDGNIPFKEVVLNPVAGRFYGLGPAEVVRHLQDSVDALLMVYTDAADAAVRVPLLVGNSFAGNKEQLRRRAPLDLISCANPDAVKPIPVDHTALQFGAQEWTRRKLAMREGTGATQPQISQTDRETATAVSEIVRLASQRVDLMVQLVEREDYPWIGKTLHSRMRQFLSPERQQIMAGETFPITLDDIDFEADIRFVGSRLAQSKAQSAAATREAIRAIGENMPLVIAMPDMFVRYLRDNLEIPDAEDIVARAVQIIGRQMQAGMAAKGGSQAASSDALGTAVGEVQREGQRVGGA